MEHLVNILLLLFQKIPRGLFEPFAIGAVTGGLFSLLFPRKHRYFFWFFWFSILCMLTWRLAILIISSRYASILIYPSVMLTAYACFEAGRVVNERKWIHTQLCRWLPYVILGGIILGCLGKALMVNSYEYHREEAYAVIRKELKNEEALVLVSNGEEARVKYYTGATTHRIYDATNPMLKSLVQKFKNHDTLILFDVIEPANTPMMSKKELGVPDAVEWERIYSSYTNRKEKRKHNIYRYRPLSAQKK